MKEKFKIARIKWYDATHYRNEQDFEWLQENACGSEFDTVGHVLKAGRKEIIIAHEINNDGRARDTSVIPRVLIKEIKYLQ
ncbi:hypothetical protein LCGC14_2211660 [marine sediment metagenome]|uniref:Uncharacterized protein n=1 Tax=marine sediment metagenome TaxID=412755 RepID=A0A0F9G9B3_9ZZZZ